MALVYPPKTPSRATGEIEVLLDALGFVELDSLDEEAEVIVENHADLFEEIAAFARRGWAISVDIDRDDSDENEWYADALRRLLAGLDVDRVAISDDRRSVDLDGTIITIAPPQDSDYFDFAWVVEVARRFGAGRGYIAVEILEPDPWDTILGLVPAKAWTAVIERGLAGQWRVFRRADEDVEQFN